MTLRTARLICNIIVAFATKQSISRDKLVMLYQMTYGNTLTQADFDNLDKYNQFVIKQDNMYQYKGDFA